MDTTTADVIENLGQSTIHHGPFNRRIYLMKLHPGDMPGIIDELLLLAEQNAYTKITAKVGAQHTQAFLAAGFRHEACLPGFYPDGADAFYMALFLDPSRADIFRPKTVVKVINTALRKPCNEPSRQPPAGLTFRELGEPDAPAMAALYGRVFATYPFPITEPEYLIETMRSHIFYYGLAIDDRLVALASMETDKDNAVVEMADFATESEARGAGAAGFLLGQMEQAGLDKGFRFAFTIARSTSFGMNIAFARAGYLYSGTMVNNTNIAGNTESMNMWYRRLST
ncbi:MAG: putative beta-lysine N-acetyltransferase [Desulfohalobiaceae bacterium]